PVGKLLAKLALPSVAAQIINMLYNIVDRIYIGNIPEIGAMALTGVGVTFPILLLVSAFAAFAGMGAAPLASIQLGAGDRAGAERILGNSLTMLLVIAAVLTGVFGAFKEPILYAFGASDNIIGYALDYISIYLLGTVFVQLALGLNAFISAQGNATTAMLSVLIGAVLNIVLDPIFIFVLGMGVRGAALATVLSQAVSALWVLSFLCSKRSVIRVKISNMRPNGRIIGRIASLGIAPFIMQSTESLVNIVLNTGLQTFGGDLYVGSMTIMQSIMQMLVMPVNGITQGAQPIMSYNYGAKNYDRVRQTFRLLLKICLIFTVACCLFLVLLPGVPARMFTSEPALIELVKKTMPVFFAGIWAFGAQMACQVTFMSLGQAKTTLFLALLRKIILLIPLAIILPRIMGTVMGIYIAEPIADILASFTTLTLFLIRRKTLLPNNGK
ncbi:MATE family efflux transporter, partial [uncultured Ruthenibacterium sp.]|uniref:MATE family efflux transporter n=1 Tax=uncultured Ruthenibacterium sp. TaxID=1905347 RepID=UPI00349EC97D